MIIKEVLKNTNQVVVGLSSGELVHICNYLPISKDVPERFSKLHASLMLARDLSQYGLIDEFSLASIVSCNDIEKISKLAHLIREVNQK